MYRSIARFMANEDGATAIEYTLIAGATGLALVVIMPGFAEDLMGLFTPLVAALTG